MKHRLILFVLLCSCSLAAAAGGRYVPLAERLSPAQLREVGLSDAQVAQLDALLREADAARPSQPADAGAVAPTPGDHAGLDVAAFESTVRGEVAGWAPGTDFSLANGQVWRVLKGHMRLAAPRPSPRVRLVPGVAGRWFLEVDPDLPKARVYRVD